MFEIFERTKNPTQQPKPKPKLHRQEVLNITSEQETSDKNFADCLTELKLAVEAKKEITEELFKEIMGMKFSDFEEYIQPAKITKAQKMNSFKEKLLYYLDNEMEDYNEEYKGSSIYKFFRNPLSKAAVAALILSLKFGSAVKAQGNYEPTVKDKELYKTEQTDQKISGGDGGDGSQKTTDERIVNNQEKKEVTPDSYDLSKVAVLDKSDLEGKKSLNPETIKKIIYNSLIRSKVFNSRSEWDDKMSKLSKIKDDLLLQKQNLNKADTVNIKRIDAALSDMNPKFSELYKESADIIKKEELIESGSNLENLPINLEKSDKEHIKMAERLFKEIEAARKDLKRLIQSEGYLKKLQIEFGSLAEARRHQQVRLSNIDLANYDLLSLKEVKFNSGKGVAYFIDGTNKVIFPYDIYDNNGNRSMYDLAFHEFCHEIINGNAGLSKQSYQLLEKTFFPSSNQSTKTNEYHSSKTERYVRLEALENDLDRLGIKKINEEFTIDHYKKMRDLMPDGKFSEDAEEFIYFLMDNNSEDGFKTLKELFDKIAHQNNSKEDAKNVS